MFAAFSQRSTRPDSCPRGGRNALFGRRSFLRTAASGTLLSLLPADEMLTGELLAGESPAAKSPATDFVSHGIDPARLWYQGRQLVYAYYQPGDRPQPTCLRLNDARADLPVRLIWKKPPDWVKIFPTIHFEISSRAWIKYAGWKTLADFERFYSRYNPPPKSPHDVSPFKQYAQRYRGGTWTYPGKISDHLLDPTAPHRFSEYELRGLTKVEQERLHSAHHESLIQPGRAP